MDELLLQTAMHLPLLFKPDALLLCVLGLVARHLEAVLATVHIPRLLRKYVKAACAQTLVIATVAQLEHGYWRVPAQRTMAPHLAPRKPVKLLLALPVEERS